MQCPRCGDELEAHHRGGVEIDVCPRCGGVWLDRGEMDKLVYEDGDAVIGAPQDAPAVAPASPSPVPVYRDRDRRRDHRHDDDDDDDDRRSEKRRKRKKESFVERLADALEDIFD